MIPGGLPKEIRSSTMPKEATLMKGKAEVLEVLQKMLKEELGSISQYFVHAEMC